MSDYEIECAVPIPPRRRNGRNGEPKTKYPFREMAIKDSFAFDGRDLISVKASAAQFKKRRAESGWDYTTRKISPGKYRLWRIA